VSCRCASPAAFKCAAAWSDGLTPELKTYALCCEGCLSKCFEEAKQRQAACPLELGESLEVPQIFARGKTLLRLDLTDKSS